MRAYFFGNMYLSSIQQGIQAAHVTAELFSKYQIGPGSHRTIQYGMLMDWAMNHKTMVLLNAGYSEEIHALFILFKKDENPYPWTTFKESMEALEGIRTSIGIVLPERIYGTAKYCREEKVAPYLFQSGAFREQHGMPSDLSDLECELILTLNNYSLAR